MGVAAMNQNDTLQSKMTSGKAYLKRSQFAVGTVKAFRGLMRDMRTLAWLAGRNGRIKSYLMNNQVKKLQLGTSDNIIHGWLNTDVVPANDSVLYLDATIRFPFDDNVFDYIMAEHMIEHIEYGSAQVMLTESFRVLKPGGRVRFATPDLEVLLSLHSREKTDAQRKYIEWSSERFLPGVQACNEVFVINNFFQSWGHRFLYDKEMLSHALQASGFHEIKFYKPGNSDDPLLRNLESHGSKVTEEINQFETIVVEGCKN